MSETDKLIIDILEKEEVNLSGKGALESIAVTGVLCLINPSKTHRIWNIMRVIEGIETTNIQEKEVKIGAIEATAKNMESYKIVEKDVEYKPLINLSEVIDTYFEKGDDINWNFVLNNRMPSRFTLKLENNSAQPTSNVVLHKKLPEFFDEPVIESTSSGNASYEAASRKITWTDLIISPDQEQVLIFRVGVNPTSVEPHPTGEIELDYTIEEVQKSKIDPKVTAVSKSMFALEKMESMDKQSNWDCKVEFQNLSDFQMRLDLVKVLHSKNGTKAIVLEEQPEVKLNPTEEWVKLFAVTDEKPPKLAKSNNFTILTKVDRRVIGHVIKNSGDIPVAAIEAQKIVDPQEIPAHAKTEINVKLTVRNSGSAPLSTIDLTDLIPAGFKAPSLDQIQVFFGEDLLRQGTGLEIVPYDEDPNREHQLLVKIPDLNEVRGPLAPGEEFTVKYPLVAWDPKPSEYPCPVKANFNVLPPGQPVNSSTPESKFIARQVKRSYRAFKQVQPGSEEDEYLIKVVFQNKGEVPVESCKVTEHVPEKFVLVSCTPKELQPESTENTEGIDLSWHLTNIGAGSEIILTYNIKGSGEYYEEDPVIEFV